MTEHLFKLKNKGKTVGYMQLQKQHPPNDYLSLLWRYSSDGKTKWTGQRARWPSFDSAHPFATQDKHGKDVFAGDKVIYQPPDLDELCEDEKEELEASVVGGFFVFDIEGTDFVKASKFGDIELIEDNETS